MILSIRLFGFEFLHVEQFDPAELMAEPEPDAPAPGVISDHFGFAPEGE